MSIKLRQLVLNKLFDSWRPTVAAFELFCFLYLVVSTNVQYFLASHPALGMSVNRKKRKMSENMVLKKK